MSQDTTPTPSVLVVLVSRNGEPWLRDCLAGLAAQEYPRLGVLGVDAGSRDGSRDLLIKALGKDRVLDSAPNAEAVLTAAMGREGTADADFILLLHDDVVLGKDAILRLVEAAATTEAPGAIGPKLVDWDEPRVLLDVGWSADRFGHPYSPLEAGELDQGQHDRISEVLYVSGSVMLIATAALLRAGPPDGRLGFEEFELDLCWRFRLAGFHVVMTPLAVARHRDAGRRGERRGDRSGGQRRYYQERGAGVALSKNYGLGSVWVIPLYLIYGVIKLLGLLLGRRFGEMGQILAAWGWNIVRFPGTVVRRVKIQAVRAVKDREIHRFMAHGSVRLRRWLDAAGRFLPGDVDLPDDEDQQPQESFAERASTAARGHPVAAAWVAVVVLAALAYRPLFSSAHITGGWLPASLPGASDFLRELGSGFRTTVLGGAQAASPALAVWGGVGSVPLVTMDWVEKGLLALLPIAAAMTSYKMALRLSGQVVPSLFAAGCYALSSLMLWSFSDGRIPMLAAMAVLPKVLERFDIAFAPEIPLRRTRLVVGTAIFLGFGAAFMPGILLAVGVMALAYLIVPERLRRLPGGLALAIAVALGGTALVFPVAVDAAGAQGIHLSSLVGSPDLTLLSRLVPVDGTSAWPIAWFLPLAAALGLMLSDAEHRRCAWRLFLVVGLGLTGAWASTSGWLPLALTNAGAYLAVATVGCAGLVAIGLGAASTMERRFSLRWITSLVMFVVVGLGLGLQTFLAALGLWGVGTSELPAAWPLVASDAREGERILWLGRSDGEPFPSPGGDPAGTLLVGGPGVRTSSVRYAITDRQGFSALDTARPSWGPGYDYLESTLTEIVAGDGLHGGALLGPLGIRFIVAAAGDLPAPVREGIAAQVDIDQVPAGGLLIYRNASAWPSNAVIQGEDTADAIANGDPASVARADGALEVASMEPVDGGWDGKGEGTAWVADQYASDWALVAGPATVRARDALGWALSFQSPGAGEFQIRYGGQGRHTAEMWLLAGLWAIAIWFTRKPVRR